MNRFNILSLSGGGYRGMYTLIILEYLEQQKGELVGRSCDLITGASVGGIIALALAAEIPVREIKEFLEQNKAKIFYRGLRNAWKFPCLSPCFNAFGAKYSAQPLRECLIEFFEKRYNIKKIADLKHRVVITAVNYKHRSSQYFKTAHHERFQWDYKLSVVDVALATSAAPTYFPPHKIDFGNGKQELLIDGALSNNAPSFIGYHEAKNELDKKKKDIYLVNIGTASDRMAPYKHKCGWGLFAWVKDAIFLTMNAQEKSSEYMTRHTLKSNYLHIDSLVKNGLEFNNQYKAEFSPEEFKEIFALDDISEKTISKIEAYAQNTIANISHHNDDWIRDFLKYTAPKFNPHYTL